MKEILILYPSWEDRASLGFEDYANSNKIDLVLIIEKQDSLNQDKTQTSLFNIKNLCSLKKIPIETIIVENNDKKTFEDLQSLIQQLGKDNNVTIDITTMSRNIIWMLLFFIKEKFEAVKIIYTLPKAYCGDWISKEPSIPSLLLKHSGIIDLDLKNCLIIITGFDTDRTKQLVRFYEPQKIVLLIQTGIDFDNNKRNNAEEHKLVCEELGYNVANIDIQSIDSYSSDLGYSSIQKLIKSYKPDYNIILASLGPKLSAISLYQIYLKNTEVALSYVPCKEYNPNYCTGVGEQKTYNLDFRWK